MTTAPYSPEAVAATTGTVTTHWALVAAHPDWADPVPLSIEAGSITFDEGWSPHVQASFTTPLPDPTTLAALDPRTGVRLELTAGYYLPTGALESHPMADLGLRSRDATRPDNALALDAASDEALLQDWEPLGQTRNYLSSAATGATVVDLVTWALPSASTVNLLSSTTTIGAALEVTTGDNLWDTVADVADRDNAWVYDNGLRTWTIRDRPTTTSKSSASLRTGIAGNLERTQSGLSRDEWANAVRLTYADDTQVWGRVTSGPYAEATAGRKVVHVHRETRPGSIAAAKRAAATIAARAVTRGRSHTLTAPALHWVRPGQTVTQQIGTGNPVRALVSRVQFDLTSDTMEVTTRIPETVTTDTGE